MEIVFDCGVKIINKYSDFVVIYYLYSKVNSYKLTEFVFPVAFKLCHPTCEACIEDHELYLKQVIYLPKE